MLEKGLRAGDKHIEKTLNKRFICGYSNLVNSILLHDKAMINVHGYVYVSFQSTYGVGFGIAYLHQEGNTRA